MLKNIREKKQVDIDTRRIWYWKKQKNELNAAQKTRARLAGGGRKKVSLDIETSLVEWIFSVHNKHNRVSRKMIKNKALEIYLETYRYAHYLI